MNHKNEEECSRLRGWNGSAGWAVMKEGRKEGTYLFDQTTIQYIFMKMQWSGDCR